MTQPQALTLQGVAVPRGAINPQAFFALTRRHRNAEKNAPYAGLGGTDNVELKKSDILAGLRVRFSGNLVVALGGGTVASTMQWPHNLLGNGKFIANGQSNLINCSGLDLKLREFLREGVDDHGIVQNVGAGTAQAGTLSKSSESWGVGAGVAGIAGGTYPVELEWIVPVAEDEKDLAGAIFAQTSTQDLVLQLNWNQPGALFVTTGGATVTLTGNLIVETEKFSIPAVQGTMVLPDLSLFHSIIATRTNTLANGENELRIIGQGAGKQLLRIWYRTWNGAAPQTPLAATAPNYGNQSWRYGTNETPETYLDGRSLRQVNEDEYGVDIGAVWGNLAHEFAVRNAFRDTVDMGQTSELRLVSTIGAGVVLNSPVLEYVQETMFAAGQ